MFLSFEAYLAKAKRVFHAEQFETDLHYRAVLFHQYGESFRWYCKHRHIMNDYDTIAYEVILFEKRLEGYRST